VTRATTTPFTAYKESLARGGELGARIRDFDWSTTPLGSVSEWPQSLKTIVRVLVTSRYAMWMSWGPNLTFLYNDAYARMTLGKKHPWALGKPSQEVWAEIWPEIGPRIHRVFETGKATWDEGLLLFLERSGYPEETYHTFSYSPLTGDDDQIQGHLCVVTEETDRIIGERRLASLRSLGAELSLAITEGDVLAAIQRSLQQNTQDLPFTLTYLFENEEGHARLACSTGVQLPHDAAPEIIDINVASAATWPIAELLNKKTSLRVPNLVERFRDLPSGSWDKPPREALMVPISKQGQDMFAGVLVAALNPYRQLDAAYSGFIDLVAGQIAAGIANARAYAEERKRAHALEEIDKAKTAFFSNVSHEFRTPLTLMLGPTEDALAKPDKALSGSDLETVHRNELRLLKLVNTLLEFSRLEAGRIQASFRPTDLQAYTLELCSVFRSAMEKAGLEYTIEGKPLPEPVYVDRDMWEKIVLNLLSNALKSTFEGGVAVSLKDCSDHVELKVRDTGTGIPEREIPHLFERFRRIENARRRTHEGSGIGLALVNELVSMHGGTIAVSSQVGKGTTFTVSLPYGVKHLPKDRISEGAGSTISSTARAAFVEEALGWLPGHNASGSEYTTLTDFDSVAVSKSAIPGQGTRCRVLLVDDNLDMREYVRRLLSTRFDVVTATNGREALHKLASDSPDLVLTDVMMPEMDGLQLLAEIRNNPAMQLVPVILLSARAGEEAEIEGVKKGADDYLVKPFSARELLARVQTHLDLAQIRRAAAETLRENERRFREMIDALPAAVYTTDAEGRLTHFNPAAVEFAGRLPDLGKDRWSINWKMFQKDGTPLPHHECPMAISIKEGRSIHGVESIAERPDGKRVWYMSYPMPLHDAEGKVVGGINMLVDISERKQAENVLRQSEEELRILNRVGATLASELDLKKLLQAVTDAGRELSEAAFGAFFYNVINEAGESYMLYTLSGAPEEAFNKFPMPRNTAVFGPTFAGEGTIRIDDVLKDPRYGKSAPYHGMPPGHLPVRSYLAVPVFSRSGEVIGGLFYGHSTPGVFTQRAERLVEGIAKQAAIAFENARLFEAAQREREQAEANAERFRTIVDTTPECVMVVEPEGAVQLINPSGLFMLGAKRAEDVVGKNIYELVVPNDRPRFKEFNETICAGQRGTLEFDIVGQHGMLRHMESHGAPMRNQNGQVVHLAVCRDITERKRAEDALRRSEKLAAVGRLAATVAHEINNPLESITNLLFLAKKDPGIGEAARQHLTLADQELDRVAHVARQTLGFYRDSAAPTELSVAQSIDELLSVYNYRLRNRDIAVQKDIDSSAMIFASAAEFRQVFSNLILNAIDAMPPEGGRIWIKVRTIRADAGSLGVRITVGDNGCGITSEHLPKIFDSFYTTKEEIGTGLGLWLARTIIQKYGGRISVRSRVERGRSGTVFSLFWPTYADLKADTTAAARK
jgi:PAS domain S-box-containing protein